ncbi:MAG TPA: hypothetical protein VJT73_11865, partial [Polyangiaceae bacterium]|nr:hypothetical protein [Polyangiaceae bacterium]
MGWVGWVLFGLLAAPLGALALGEPNSDRSAAEQILATLPSASASARARSPVAEARRALERAAGARKSG